MKTYIQILVCLLAIQGLAQNTIQSGSLTATPTLYCIGLRYEVTGDANMNAGVAVTFREAGSVPFHAAMPLYRPAASRFMGSIFHLKPGTSYDIHLVLTDPDGGSKDTLITTSTGKLPILNLTGRTPVFVTDSASLRAALANTGVNTIFLRPGVYRGRFLISRSGTVDYPLYLMADTTNPGDVVFDGGSYALTTANQYLCSTPCLTLSGQNIHISGIKIRNHCGGMVVNGTGNAVTKCELRAVCEGFSIKGSQCYFADNTLTGDYAQRERLPNFQSYDGHSEGTGFWIESGSRNTICYNKIERFSDAIRTYAGDNDVFGNDVYVVADDMMEFDYGDGTIRAWGNRGSYTGANGFTFQPYENYTGYLIRNVVVNLYEDCIKDRSSSPDVYYLIDV